jgi:hypothetical protein
MTRKDFVLIAAALKDSRPVSPMWPASAREAANEVIDRASVRFCNELAATNPRFDRERFLKACGVQS